MKVTVNDKICLAGEIEEQRSGAWTARIEVDEESESISGKVTIKVGDESFVGTAVRGETPDGQGRWIGHIVGGAGGLEKDLDAKNYHRVPLRSVVTDALNEAGETLDSALSDSAALSALQGHWTRARGRARVALTAAATKMGGFWRVTRAGKAIFRKTETWQKVDFDFEYIDKDPSDGTLEIAPNETPGARPGVTFAGHKVAAVRTVWSGAGVRQEIALGSDAAPEQPQSTGEIFADGVRKATESAVNYSQIYRSKVISQGADGTIDILPDDPRVRGAGLSHVEIMHGIPGLTVKVVPGNYVRLYFENGAPDQPRCALWPDGSSVQSVALASPEIKLGPTTSPTQSAVRGNDLMDYIDQVVDKIYIAINTIPPQGGGAAAATQLKLDLLTTLPAKLKALSTGIKLE